MAPLYRWYVLTLLVLIGIVGWADRNVLAILLGSIKSEFSLSDTQLGLLGGAAFGVFYATVGLPVAWLADRFSRRFVIALAVGLWSLMTAMCGLAAGFASLFLARVGVGVGEAGGTPASHAIVSDYFPPQRRAFALGILYLYIPLGFLLGFGGAGWLNEHLGWRSAFVVVGAPGVLLSLLAFLTLRELPRAGSEQRTASHAVPSLWSTFRSFVSRPTLRQITVAGVLHGLGAFAANVWLPSFFMRVHQFGSAEAGLSIAVVYGIGGLAGVLLGGYGADYLVRATGNPRWHAWVPAIALGSSVPLLIAVFVAADARTALWTLLVALFLGHCHPGPMTAMFQNIAGPRQRAATVAVYLFFANLVGVGVGPVLAGFVSDYFSAIAGNDSLRYALLAIVPLTTALASVHFLLASRTLSTDVAVSSDQIPSAMATQPSS